LTLETVRRLLRDVEARPPGPSEPAIDGTAPALVLLPEDEDACAKALALCHEEQMAVVPVGAATRLEAGNPPSRLDAYLSTLRLAGVDDHIPGDLTVAVRAGTTLGALQRELARAGQFLPVDPPRPDEATIGGIFALGEPGFRRRPGARPRDLLLGFEAVLADGTRVKAGGRVVKNVAGYEIMKLFVGSSGTLAVMTRAFLRLRALPEKVTTVALRFRRALGAAEVFQEIARLPLAPEATALVNPVHADALGLGLGVGEWTMLLRFEGFREETSQSVEEVRRRQSPRPVEVVPSEIWDELREFPVRPLGEGEMLLRAQAAPSRSFGLAEGWQDGGRLVVYPDGGLLYSHTEDPEALSHRRDAARLAGANVVVERAPSAVKQESDVFGELPPGFELMKRTKERLDPKGILSPGRFVGRL